MKKLDDILPQKVVEAIVGPSHRQAMYIEPEKLAEYPRFSFYLLNYMLKNNCFHYIDDGDPVKHLMCCKEYRGQASILILQHFCQNNELLLNYGIYLDALFCPLESSVKEAGYILPQYMWQDLLSLLCDISESQKHYLRTSWCVYRMIAKCIRLRNDNICISLPKSFFWKLFRTLNKEIEEYIIPVEKALDIAIDVAFFISRVAPEETWTAIGKQYYARGKNYISSIAACLLLARSKNYDLLDDAFIRNFVRNWRGRFSVLNRIYFYFGLAEIIITLLRNHNVSKETLINTIRQFIVSIGKDCVWSLYYHKRRYMNYVKFNALIGEILQSEHKVELISEIIFQLCKMPINLVTNKFYKYFYDKLMKELSPSLLIDILKSLSKYEEDFEKPTERTLLPPREFFEYIQMILLEIDKERYKKDLVCEIQKYWPVLWKLIKTHIKTEHPYDVMTELCLILAPDKTLLKSNLREIAKKMIISNKRLSLFILLSCKLWKELYGEAEVQSRLDIVLNEVPDPYDSLPSAEFFLKKACIRKEK